MSCAKAKSIIPFSLKDFNRSERILVAIFSDEFANCLNVLLLENKSRITKSDHLSPTKSIKLEIGQPER